MGFLAALKALALSAAVVSSLGQIHLPAKTKTTQTNKTQQHILHVHKQNGYTWIYTKEKPGFCKYILLKNGKEVKKGSMPCAL